MATGILSCPLQTKGWVSFRLVDEAGNSTPYAYLDYLVIDIEGKEHKGQLDTNGYAKLEGIKGDGVLLRFDAQYQSQDDGDWYKWLMKRENYPLKITQLQYIAEQTRHLKANETFDTTKYFKLCDISTFHYPFEVIDFVRYNSHLPKRQGTLDPEAIKYKEYVRAIVSRQKTANYGVGLATHKNHVLVVKALRAWRPVVSTEQAFSALNMFQLALMASLAYRDFEDEGATANPWYPKGQKSRGYSKGDIGYVLNEWAHYRQPKEFGKANQQQPAKTYQFESWMPFLEDVPYSKRFEIVPFDPELYPTQNLPTINGITNRDYETPTTVHSFDKYDSFFKHIIHFNDTQGYAIHNDQIVLLVPRGTQENTDFLLDARAKQVAVQADEGKGNAHSGFYDSFIATKKFYNDYLTRFYVKGQHKIVVAGHSLGGAMATLTAEWIRNRWTKGRDNDVVLYTYGSPRTGDKVFVQNAKALTHYRIVSHYDPITTVPWATMSTKWPIISAGTGVLIAGNPIVGGGVFLAGARNLGGDDYWHHGELHHLTSLDEGQAKPNRWLNSTVQGNKLTIMAAMLQPAYPEQSIKDRAEGKDSLMVPLYSATNVIMWQPTAVGIKNDVLAHIYKKGKAYGQRNGLPYENSFWYDTFSSFLAMNNHFMLVSYVPAAWAVLERWRKAVKYQQGQQISDDEYHTLYSGVTYYSQELFKAEDELNLNKMKPKIDLNFANKQISIELNNTRDTIARVSDLRTQPVTLEMIYGKDVLVHPEFKQIVAQWEKADNERIMDITLRLFK